MHRASQDREICGVVIPQSKYVQETHGTIRCQMERGHDGAHNAIGWSGLPTRPVFSGLLEREKRRLYADCAVYLLDRADQYETDSGSWVALVDCARAIVNGEVDAAKDNGELTADLYERLGIVQQKRIERATE